MGKLAHIGVVVKDVERSKEFYEKFCGCQPVKLTQDAKFKLYVLDAGGQTILLVQFLSGDWEESRGCHGVVDHIAFEVRDIDAAVEKLRSAGIKLQMEKPQVEKIINAKVFLFFGPDGERVEYVQYLD